MQPSVYLSPILSPLLIGFLILLLLDLFLLYVFCNGIWNCHYQTNFMMHSKNTARTLITGLLPTLCSLSITCFIWGLFIWAYYTYFSKNEEPRCGHWDCKTLCHIIGPVDHNKTLSFANQNWTLTCHTYI
uniref:Middle protein n=1 Tax=Porcine bufavirus TaxID=1828531 RepID=A0A514EJ35_9VIRU|nr:hypothetical protein [Porcine bufavirus]